MPTNKFNPDFMFYRFIIHQSQYPHPCYAHFPIWCFLIGQCFAPQVTIGFNCYLVKKKSIFLVCINHKAVQNQVSTIQPSPHVIGLKSLKKMMPSKIVKSQTYIYYYHT